MRYGNDGNMTNKMNTADISIPVSKAELMASGLTNGNISTTLPDRFLSLFGPEDMLDIGDEVTVPSSPSPFANITDHSYVSSSRGGTPLPRFIDCVSGYEFHDLFDLSTEYQPFDLGVQGDDGGIGLQEQVVDSNQNSNHSGPVVAEMEVADTQKGLWMIPLNETEQSREDESMDNYHGSSSSSDSETDRSQENENARARKRKKGHHTGPFPHTYISVPGDRRIRFCFGLRTIVTKIRALISRTGSTADFRAEFEGHVFTLDNVDKLLKFSDRSQKSKPNKAPPESTTSTTVQSNGEGGADDDHRYAATILTQSESSSSVRDHQYNDDIVKAKRKKPVQKSYIRTRYARERWLRKCATTIYTKMQRLVNRTGAKMTLRIEYEGLVVTPMNYKELEHLLGNCTSTAKKFNTKIIVQKPSSHVSGTIQEPSCTHSFSSSVLSNTHGEEDGSCRMLSVRPWSNRSLQVELVNTPATSPSKLLQTVVESDHDYQSSSLRSSPRLDCPLLSPFNAVQEEAHHSDDHYRFAFHDEDAFQRSSISGSSSSLVSAAATAAAAAVVTKTAVTDASSNTEPICQVCWKSQGCSSSLSSIMQQWIRCANPLCHYLVHPSCIGFFVTSPQSLQFLPLYFCPAHRNQTPQ